MFYVRKDPDAIDDYAIDWTAWLAGETIASVQWLADPPMSVVSATVDGTRAIVRLQGGTAGQKHRVTCRVTTSSGRVNDATLVVVCVEQ